LPTSAPHSLSLTASSTGSKPCVNTSISRKTRIPADTAFVPSLLAEFDCVVAMYHDQGLPVLKHASFGHGINITLGLPILRTSVDHGTALDLAMDDDAARRADPGSLFAAVELAISLTQK